MPEKAAFLIDGGFIKKKIQEQTHQFPTIADVIRLITNTMAKPPLVQATIFRIYFYDAPPYQRTDRNPLDGTVLNFATTPQALQNQALLQALDLQPNFAVRRGMVAMRGWKLKKWALRALAANPRVIAGRDIEPDMNQKGVDMRIGLDIAWMSTKRIVDAIVLVTGDSDFVPAMKFARKEGIRVYLETMGHSVRVELKVHADIVL
jgi:uncharacterized LabA/DUF88 family protein